MTHIFPAGTSEPQDFELLSDDEALDGTGFDVDIVIYTYVEGRAPVALNLGSPAPSVEWLDQAAGTVRVTGCESLDAGTYLVRYRLTDGDDKDGFFPNGMQADVWRVVAVPGI